MVILAKTMDDLFILLLEVHVLYNSPDYCSCMDSPESPKEEPRNPIWYLVAVFILLMLIISIFPLFTLKSDAYPRDIPVIDDLVSNLKLNMTGNRTMQSQDYRDYLTPDDPFVKNIATRIASLSCQSGILCQTKAEFYFVRDNFEYVSEYNNYIQKPIEMFYTRGGDCDDHAILLANLLRAIGIHTRFVLVPGHIYVQAYIKDVPRRYTKDGWINLDPTCKSCDFAQIAPEYLDSEKHFL